MNKFMKRVVMTILISTVFTMFSGCGISDAERKTAEFEINGESVCVDYTDVEAEFVEKLDNEYSTYQLYDSSELTGKMLEERNGRIIVERCIGIVENSESGDGRILNYQDPDYYYISYHRVDNVRDGAIVLTYMIYDPDDNYIDGIMERYDFILNRGIDDYISKV